MIRASPFRASELFWLGEDAAAVGSGAARPEIARARRLVIARGLCRFHRMTFPLAIGARACERAARLHAETNSPYDQADFVIVRQRNAATIWWWDRASVERALGDDRVYRAQDCIPESLLYAAGDGPRQIQTSDGFEAQIWREGALVASAWRRTPFTDAQWRAFSVSAGWGDADAAPMPIAAEVDGRTRAHVRSLQPAWGWPEVTRIAIGAGALCALIAAFLLSYGLRQSTLAATRIAERAALQAAIDADPQTGKMAADLAVVRSYERQSDYVEALGVAAHGLSIVRETGVEPTRWSVENGAFEIGFDSRTAPAPVNAVAIALEQDERFEQVVPRLDSIDGAARVTARIAQSRGGGAR